MGTPKTNAQFIMVKSGDMETKYTPDQITEYGFKDGPVYKSKNISVSGQPKRVFLERIERGKLTLYYYTEEGLKLSSWKRTALFSSKYRMEMISEHRL